MRDGLLVRNGVRVRNVKTANYDAQYPLLKSSEIAKRGRRRDAWAQAYRDPPGLTCCHGVELRDATKVMRGGFVAVRGAVTGAASTSRIGGRWPSDHGGLGMSLRLTNR